MWRGRAYIEAKGAIGDANTDCRVQSSELPVQINARQGLLRIHPVLHAMSRCMAWRQDQYECQWHKNHLHRSTHLDRLHSCHTMSTKLTSYNRLEEHHTPPPVRKMELLMKLAVRVQQIVGHVQSNITISEKSHWITALHMVLNSKAELIISRIWGSVDNSKVCPSNLSCNSRLIDQSQHNEIIYICLSNFNTAMYSSNQTGIIPYFITYSTIQNRMEASVGESMSKFCPLNSSYLIWG